MQKKGCEMKNCKTFAFNLKICKLPKEIPFLWQKMEGERLDAAVQNKNI